MPHFYFDTTILVSWLVSKASRARLQQLESPLVNRHYRFNSSPQCLFWLEFIYHLEFVSVHSKCFFDFIRRGSGVFRHSLVGLEGRGRERMLSCQMIANFMSRPDRSVSESIRWPPRLMVDRMHQYGLVPKWVRGLHNLAWLLSTSEAV